VFGEFFEPTNETTKHVWHPISLPEARQGVELYLTALPAAQLS
jgi:hypothetical protein